MEEVKHRFAPTEKSHVAHLGRQDSKAELKEQREALAEKKAAKLKAQADAEADTLLDLGKTQLEALKVRTEKVDAEKKAITESKEAAREAGLAAGHVARLEDKSKEAIGQAAYQAVMDGGGSCAEAARVAIEQTSIQTDFEKAAKAAFKVTQAAKEAEKKKANEEIE